MSLNLRVNNQMQVAVMAYGTKRFDSEREKYWQIVEEEFKKDPENGWIDLEDPHEPLWSFVEEGDKEMTAYSLSDYKRFLEITGRSADDDLIRRAEALLA